MSGFRHVTVDDACLSMQAGPWWIAHEHPERPPDPWVLWSWECDACIMHLIAASAADPHELAYSVGPDVALRSHKEGTLAEARAWRAERGMRPL